MLIALTEPAHVHHGAAQRWFTGQPALSWGVCPLTEAGFVRVTTNPSFRPVPRSIGQAVAILQMLRDYPGYSFWEIDESWITLTAPFAARISGHLQVTDAYLLGLAIRNKGILVTFDKGVEMLAGTFRNHVLVLP